MKGNYIEIDYQCYQYVSFLENQIISANNHVANLFPKKRRIKICLYFVPSTYLALFTYNQKTTDSLALTYFPYTSADILVDPLFIYFCLQKKEKLPNHFFISQDITFRILSCVIHSLLHCYGFNHDDEENKKIMFQHEENISRLIEQEFC